MAEVLVLVGEWLTGVAILTSVSAILLILRHERRCEERQDKLWSAFQDMKSKIDYIRGKMD